MTLGIDCRTVSLLIACIFSCRLLKSDSLHLLNSKSNCNRLIDFKEKGRNPTQDYK